MKFGKKKKNRRSYFNIYIVVFAFLSSSVEKCRWQKLNEMFVFGILFIAMSECYNF